MSASLQITVGEGDEQNEVLKERLAEVRRDLLGGRDAWSRRFETMDPDKERIVMEKADGILEKSIHHALIQDPRKLSRFFSDTPVRAVYGSGEGWAELILDPGSADRATRAERDRFRKEKREWSSAIAEYLTAVRSLYAYLESRPERAESCFGNIFDVFLSDEAKKELVTPTDEEESLQKAVEDGIGKVTSIFSVDEGEAYSIEEVSRLVNDPFPAPVRVQVPSKVLEVDGFGPIGDLLYQVPGLSLWGALASLEEHWVRPDLVVVFYKAEHRKKSLPFDLHGLAALPRQAAPAPSTGEVDAAISERLSPAPQYRIRWSTAGVDKRRRKGEDPAWEELED